MKLIALVGESPNDTAAVKVLLEKRFRPSEYRIENLLRGFYQHQMRGSRLDESKGDFGRFLRIEFQDKKPDVVIVIRDLDSLEDDKAAIRTRKNGFSKANRIVNKHGVFLLNIFELEALILADHDAFNAVYSSFLVSHGDPMKVRNPKEVLITASSGKYRESEAERVFERLDFDRVELNCRYFRAFVLKLQKMLA